MEIEISQLCINGNITSGIVLFGILKRATCKTDECLKQSG